MTESHRTFYGRIRRISEWPAPLTHRLGLNGTFGIFVVAILLLPMAQTNNFLANDENINANESNTIKKIELLKGGVTTNDRLPGNPVISVDFSGVAIDIAKYLHLLKSFANLTELDVSGCYWITDKNVAGVGQLTSLTTLNLSETRISGAGLAHLESLKNLTHVYLHGTDITDADLEHLRFNRKLVLIDVRSTRVTEEGLEGLRRSLPELKIFDESEVIEKIRQSGGQIARHATEVGRPVVAIYLNQAQEFDDDSVRLLKFFPRLARLDLNGTGITDSGTIALGRMQNLLEIRLGNTRVTDASIENLKNLRHLSRLSLYGTLITDAGLKHLAGIQTLSVLTLGATRITDAGLSEVSKLKNLVSLYLSWTDITDAGLRSLAGLERLAKLDLRGTSITDGAVKELNDMQADLPSLVDLNLRGTLISDQCINDMTELTKLRRLHLMNTQMTKSGLVELHKLERLAELIVDTTQVPDNDRHALKEALPRVRLVVSPPEPGDPRKPPAE